MMLNALKDGDPTGRLNNDSTLMEVACYVEDGDRRVLMGSRWVPITEEQRRQIISGNTAVVSSMGYTVDASRTRLFNDNLSDGPSTALKQETGDAAETSTFAGLSFKLDGAVKPDEIKLVRGLTIDSYSLTPEGVGFRGFAESVKTSDVDIPRNPKVEEPVVTKEDMAFWTRSLNLDDSEEPAPKQRGEHSGHNVNYYSVPIPHPKRPERAPYIFEVEDLIQALNLNFHEGTILKSLVRSATERELGLVKRGGDSIRDAEKMVHSSQEELRARKLKQTKGK
jgi:hypothetical protein